MFERLGETPVIATIIGVIATAIIVPTVKKYFFDIERKLVVVARFWRSSTPKLAAKIFQEEFGRALREDRDHVVFYFLRDVRQYLEFEISNPGKKRVENVSIRNNDISSV